MAVNKVIFGGDTIIDLTADSVTPETLAVGVTAHDKSGTKITGTMEAGSGGGSHDSCIPFTADFLYTFATVPDANYGFALNRDGYYESQNKGIPSSCAFCRLNFKVFNACTIQLNGQCYSQSYSDMGYFGKIDTALSTDATTESSANYKYRFGGGTAGWTTTSYEVEPGEHFIDIKYMKNATTDAGYDVMRFEVKPAYVEITEDATKLMQQLDRDFVAGNILDGVDIFGIVGNAFAGVSKQSTGSFVLSENVTVGNTPSTGYTIEHGLGVIPDYFILINGRDYQTTENDDISMFFLNTTKNQYWPDYVTASRTTVAAGRLQIGTNATKDIVKVWGDKETAFLSNGTGYGYKWFAIKL